MNFPAEDYPGGRNEESTAEISEETEACKDEYAGGEIPNLEQHPTIRGRWSSGMNGWWRCDLEGPRSSSALELKFSGGPTSSDPATEFQLLDMLKRVTHLRVHPSVGKGQWMTKLVRVLTTEDNPVCRLECLEIFHRMMGEVEIRVMFHAMNSGKLVGLSALLWDGLGLRNVDIQSLARVIGKNLLPSLSRLSLRRNFFRSDGLRALAECLELSQRSDKLRYLDLSGNDMGAGHLFLAKLIESGHLVGLETLFLNSTGIGDAGCEAYEKALTTGSGAALKEMGFARNCIGDRGARALARAYESGKVRSLRWISVEKNCIMTDGMMALVASLQKGGLQRLRKLHLFGNPFAEQGLLSLSQVLKSGHLNELEVLDVRFSANPTEKAGKALLAALNSNREFTADVKFEWHKFPTLDLMKTQLVERNRKHLQILAQLGGPVLPAAFAKVYLCGNLKAGKTTLTKSIRRNFWESLYTWERRPHAEKHTRGIDISRVISQGKPAEKSITLVMWDSAGQDDYHLLHNAFIPVMAFAEEKATTFVVVCSSKDEEKAVQELQYWLRFIASSCQKGVHQPRHVLVVLNRIRGDSHVLQNAGHWKQLLADHSEKFRGYLDIRALPFIVDVRKRRSVKDLKRYLIGHARQMLKSQTVPEICQFIQCNLSSLSEERKQFPILRWIDFVDKVVERTGRPWPDQTLEAAAKYLNEAGVLIYIDKEFPPEWAITNTRLVVLDPNWFCTKIVGNIFLPQDMFRPGERPFRMEVDRNTGSISISKLKKFFRPVVGEWNSLEIEILVAILLWLGLCYKGRDEKLFIPALMEENGKRGDTWGSEITPQPPRSSLDHGGGQWVMGFSVDHQPSEIALAPIALWHRYQVELAQTLKFNGQAPDNDFFVGRYFMTFNVDYMAVLIEVNAKQDRPTFDCIDVFVKPLVKKSESMEDGIARKQCQVNLAGELVEMLLRLWSQVCPGVTYVQRVVWPWPASRTRPQVTLSRNVEVAEVKRWVEVHGLGRRMQWNVGFEDITEDQLLSSKDKRNVLDSVHGSVNGWRAGIREAVELGIFPTDALVDCGTKQAWTGDLAEAPNHLLSHAEEESREAVELGIFPTDVLEDYGTKQAWTGDLAEAPNHPLSHAEKESGEPMTMTDLVQAELISNSISRTISAESESASQSTGEFSKLLHAVSGVKEKVDVLVNGHGVLLDLARKNLRKSQEVQSNLREVMRIQKELLRKVEDVGNLSLEVRERNSPRFIYLGKENSGAWMTLKEAMSPSVTVYVHFACEARYNDYGQHAVKGQQGLDVSELKEWAKKIAPWLKLSLTILFISAKVVATVVAPGLGSIFPSFIQWQQASALSDGIALATGFTREELDIHMNDPIRDGIKSTPRSPQELYGRSRRAMNELLGKLTPQEYDEKLGLRMVSLNHADGSYYGVVWICGGCYEKYRRSSVSVKLITDL